MYAIYFPDCRGEPWLDTDDAGLLDDYFQGCTVFTMAMRRSRSELEIIERLQVLGHPIEDQPTVRIGGRVCRRK